MIVIPISVEVLIRRWPISNLILLGLTILVSLAGTFGLLSFAVLNPMVLNGWSVSGMIGHMFRHAGFLHLVINMLGLWVFGNAVCEKVRNRVYPFLYLLLGLIAAVVHIVFDGNPAIGASGAISGIMGFYLVLYPINRITCFYWIFIRLGTFSISGLWILSFWFALDLFHALSAPDGLVAYWAHVGGFLAGVGLATIFLVTGLTKMDEYDNPTLVGYLCGRASRK